MFNFCRVERNTTTSVKRDSSIRETISTVKEEIKDLLAPTNTTDTTPVSIKNQVIIMFMLEVMISVMAEDTEAIMEDLVVTMEDFLVMVEVMVVKEVSAEGLENIMVDLVKEDMVLV